MTQKGLHIMLKIFHKIFPLFDHLYIYQILEYNTYDFLKWFLKNPFKRNLQKKHKLEWTQKAKLLAVSSIMLWVLDSLITSFVLSGNFWWSLILLPIKCLYFPLFLIIAQFIFTPFEGYQKQKILMTAEEKLSTLKKLKIIAITGSFGKTSTKDILYTLLWKKYYVVKTPKSFNTPLSIAQTVLEDIKDNTQIFIAEAGAYKRGEIAKLAKLLKPNIGIITAVGPQHLERFGSLKNIAEAKFELAQNLSKDGVIILNGESDMLRSLASHIGSGNVKFYGNGSQYFASDIKITTAGTSFLLHTPRATTKITIPSIGETHVKNFVAAATAALALGLSLEEIQKRAELLLPTPHRLEIKKQRDITIIDNTYNTNPDSSKTSLKLLNDLPGSQKILITPGLIELGRESSKENQNFTKEASKIADQIIIVGEYAKKDLLTGLSANKFPKEKTFTAETFTEAMNILGKISKPDTVILLENDLPDQYP